MIYHRTRSIQDLQRADIVGDFSVIDGHLGVKGQRPLRGQGAAPLAGSRGRAPCWGPAARSAGGGRGGAAPRWGLGATIPTSSGQRPEPNGIFDAL
ncbi:hypothetical protein Tco_0207847, partial [Tanacetum coccineum]